MTNEWHQVGFFVAGLAIGAAATAVIVLGPYSPSAWVKPQAAPGASQAVAFRGTDCPLEPAAPIAGAADGRYRMPAELSGYAATDPNVFITMGHEAAAAGRAHDAEVAYLMACRVADRYKGAGSVVAADARHELAKHYGAMANAADRGSPNCGELLLRAETLYSDSHELYRARYGADHEKSRQAAQGLTGVRQVLVAQASIPPATPAAVPAIPPIDAAPVLPAKPQAARAVQREKAGNRSPQKQAVARPARFSPACAAARTTAEKLICSDSELARLDREVDHLRARARNAWKYEREWRQREAMCRDRACLLQVLSQRRSQLMVDINSA